MQESTAEEMCEQWTELALREKALNTPAGDEPERKAAALLAALPPKRFLLRASIRKEWNFAALARVAAYSRALRATFEGQVLYLPRVPVDRVAQEARRLLARQVDRVRVVPFAALVDQYQEAWATDEALRAVHEAGVAAYGLVEPEYVGYPDLACKLEQLLNDKRASVRLPPLRASKALARSALLHAMDIARRGEMTHIGSDGSNCSDRVLRATGAYSRIGENLSIGTFDCDLIVTMWMDSARHRTNILGPFDSVGVGFAAAESSTGSTFNCVSVAVFAA